MEALLLLGQSPQPSSVKGLPKHARSSPLRQIAPQRFPALQEPLKRVRRTRRDFSVSFAAAPTPSLRRFARNHARAESQMRLAAW